MTTLDEVLAAYLDSHLGLSSWYTASLARSVSLYRNWSGTPQLNLIDKTTLTAWMRAMLGSKTPASVNTYRRRMLTLLRSARMKIGRVPKVPEPVALPVAWNLGQVEAIFAACQNQSGFVGSVPSRDWWMSLFQTIYWTGERIGAVLSIRSDDCDWDGCTMIVRAASHKLRRDRLLWVPKHVATLLESIHNQNRPLLWPWLHCRRHFFRQARKIIEAAGVPCPKVGKNLFHKMRRTSGSLVEANGGDGARHLGNTRAVFVAHYMDVRLTGGCQAARLPTPRLSEVTEHC